MSVAILAMAGWLFATTIAYGKDDGFIRYTTDTASISLPFWYAEENGLFEKHGLKKVAIGIHPETHPRVPDAIMHAAQPVKVREAESRGLEVYLVSQFGFEAQPYVDMARRLRGEGLTNPIRVGVAGPTSTTKLIKFALMCGVGASLRALADGIRRPAITLTIAPDLGVTEPRAAEALLRCAQEIVTNAARHSGAQRLELSLVRRAGRLALDAKDDGHGAAAVSEGHGLAGMRERVKELDGSLVVETAPARGFRVAIEVPA